MTTRPLRSLVRIPNVILIALGSASLIIYRLSLRAAGAGGIGWFLKLALIQALLYLPATVLVLKSRSSNWLLLLGIIFAALFRLSILFSPPYLSDDIYRYIWDGRVQAAGINPYRFIPADPALMKLRDDKIYPFINRRDYARTIYPPAAEAIYFLTTRLSESVTWMKATMVLFEGLAVWAIAQLLGLNGLPRQRVLLYAWHPLVVWEFSGSGHVDAIAIAFIAVALLARHHKSEIATGFSLACAALVKLFPIVLLPALYKRGRWKMPLVFVLAFAVAYLPYLGVGPRGVLGFLFGFAKERGMESGEHFFLLTAIRRLPLGSSVPTVSYVFLATVIGGALVWWIMRSAGGEETAYIRNAFIIAVAFTTLLSPHFAWYFTWLIPFLCFIPAVAVFYLTLSSFLLYLTWIYWTDDQVFRLKALIFVPFFILLTITLWTRRHELGLLSAVTEPAKL